MTLYASPLAEYFFSSFIGAEGGAWFGIGYIIVRFLVSLLFIDRMKTE
jgi:hypothetical protein